MRRMFATVMIAVITLGAVGVGVALAAELEIVPSTPDPGRTELTIDVRGFEPDTSIFALPCTVPASGDEAHVTTDGCDVSEVVSTETDATGRAIFTVEWTIPDEGIAVFVGDEQRNNQVTTILSTTHTTATAEAEDEAEAPEVAVLGTNVVQEDLAETGPRETMMLLTLATGLLTLGGISSSLGRRLGMADTAG